MNICGRTDVGLKRSQNEDSIFFSGEALGCLPNLFIIADGMGGHNAGEVASLGSIRFFREFVVNDELTNDEHTECLDTLISATNYANFRVYEHSKKDSDLSGMGTTFVATSLDKDSDKLLAAHVGDGRIYIVNDECITQITTDHTYVNEMVRTGQLTPEQARKHPKRNILTRALGTQEQVDIDCIVHPLKARDKILMCSDGLSTLVEDDEILSIMQSDETLDCIAKNLIDCANSRGGLDNISVILIEYGI